MSNEWIGSTERALEVLEGQLALARAVNAEAVQIQSDILQTLLDELKRMREPTEAHGNKHDWRVASLPPRALKICAKCGLRDDGLITESCPP